MKTVRITILLGDQQHAFLKRLAKDKGLNVSILIRQWAEKLMAEHDAGLERTAKTGAR